MTDGKIIRLENLQRAEFIVLTANEKLSGDEAVRSDAMLAAAFDLVSAARRVRAKFGTDDRGNPLDWTEWRDVDDACNAIDRIAANSFLAVQHPSTASVRPQNTEVRYDDDTTPA